MYDITTLKNGLRIVSLNMPAMKSVSIGIWVAAGGRFENKSNNGISHLLEHLVFKGTKNRTVRRIKEDIEGIGGSLNAFTSEEYTCYLAKVTGKHLALAVDVLSDMILYPLLNERDLKKEKIVVCEEIRMYHDLPMQYVHELLQELLWPNQPLGMNLTGTEETVNSITRADLLRFRRKYYNPANIVISVCGDVNNKVLIKEVEKRFSKIAKAVKNSFSKSGTIQKKQGFDFYFKETEQTHLCLGLPVFGRGHPDRYVLTLLNIILGGNMSSRLFQEVREKRGLAYDIHSSLSRYKETGAFVVSAGVENKQVFQTISVIMKVLNKIKKDLVSLAEFRRAKDFCTGQLLMALEGTSHHMSWMGEQLISRDRVKTQAQVLKAIEQVSREDLLRVADFIFKDKALNLAVIGPTKEKTIKKIKGGLGF